MAAPGIGEGTAEAGGRARAAGVGRFTIADKTNYPAVDRPNLPAAMYPPPPGVMVRAPIKRPDVCAAVWPDVGDGASLVVWTAGARVIHSLAVQLN